MFGVMSLTRAPRARSRPISWTIQNSIIYCVHRWVSMIMASSTTSTGSFQNQQPSAGSQQPSIGTFQNQLPPKKTRKRGIAALLDKINQVCEQKPAQRLCKEKMLKQEWQPAQRDWCGIVHRHIMTIVYNKCNNWMYWESGENAGIEL